MPKYAQSSDGWFGRTLGAIAQTGQANSLQGTEYIVEPSTNACQAIVGNLAAEPDGTPTGLTGFGVAVRLASGVWSRAGGQPIVTSLPTEPFDGETICYEPEEGVVWQLRYRASSPSAHKWEFVGGSAMVAGPSGTITQNSETEAPLTGGPSLVVPLAGEYDVSVALEGELQEAALTGGVGNLQASGSALGILFRLVATATFSNSYTTNTMRTALAASAPLTIGVKSSHSVIFRNGKLALTPVRVG